MFSEIELKKKDNECRDTDLLLQITEFLEQESGRWKEFIRFCNDTNCYMKTKCIQPIDEPNQTTMNF